MANLVLCGSVNLATRDDVFRAVASNAGSAAKRIPDGETGERLQWTDSQVPRLAEMVELERIDDETSAYPCFALREGADAGALRFEFDYAPAAIDSYRAFAALKRDGVIGAATRFQVSLPSPLAITLYIQPSDAPALLPALERGLLAQLQTIAASIPHDQLAIQWDLPSEVAVIEGFLPDPYPDQPGAILDMVTRLGAAVPADAELGYHLCYGDEPGADGQGQHFLQPADLSKLVALANELSDRAQRAIGWIHMPVPIERDDAAFFAPLAELRLAPETELYLGLVHHEDGLDGARRRIAVAADYVTGFGVATECGMGRDPRAAIPELLRIQAQVATPE